MSARAAALAAVLAALLLGLVACGQAPEDKARDDGRQLGEAVRKLYDADTPQQASEAMTQVQAARSDIRSDAQKKVGTQVEAQEDSIQDALDAFRTLRTSSDPAAVADARGDLRTAINDIRSQASDNRDDSVVNEFWRGFRDGFDDD